MRLATILSVAVMAACIVTTSACGASRAELAAVAAAQRAAAVAAAQRAEAARLAAAAEAAQRAAEEAVRRAAEAQAADRIRSAATVALLRAGTLSAATDAASAAHRTAVNSRIEAFLSDDTRYSSRAESIAAVSARAVAVTIGITAASADALAAAGSDATLRFDLTGPLNVVSQFSNSIAERQDTLDRYVSAFSSATQNVHYRSAEVSESVNQINSATDALSAADSISTARARLDDAMAEVVNSDVLLMDILSAIKMDADRLAGAARSISDQLPDMSTPRRDLEPNNVEPQGR